ncbi:hypothetical protein VC83_00364 [Pseudogymnoascus destructans]|uniref:Uncharacterized protein n=2 Tax=Pseudogymnoascus destructans TaxID=655981 RepID=L8FRS6_PSED2|nr:uncharacterized protein VC83_00364 [Pseudogymnoascus destructans]ELR03680.1 hypothetical protein GMDG_06320 [Pseudogymnoascus destructans 20631-21]OAF62831.1 hypothetical protein VC83_00364 [Pseudogymnoascus destructans]
MSTSFDAVASSSDGFTSTSPQSPSGETKATIMSPTPHENPRSIGAHKFTTILNARKVIDQQTDRLLADTSRLQYLLFKPVSESQYTTIDNGRYDSRQTFPKGTRLTYDADTNSLIVKLMASTRHESAHRLVEYRILFKLGGFGIPSSALIPFGGGKCKGNSTSKQPDSSYKPSFRGIHGWPTVVVESGLSESLTQLRSDVSWWFVNSEAQVHIALIISVRQDDRSIVIETWEVTQPDEARMITRSNAQQVPIRTQEISISDVAITGAPLVLEFPKIFERAAVPPEGDVVFSAQELRMWADDVWQDEMA